MTTRTSTLDTNAFAVAAVAALLLFLGTTEARAEDAPLPNPLAVVEALDARLQATPDSWQDRWDAYQAVKDDLTAEREALTPAREAWRKREAEGADALTPAERTLAGTWDEFIPVQTRIATSLRRSNLSLGAWLMGFFAASLLWGGFAVTVTIAMRSEKQKQKEASGS